MQVRDLVWNGVIPLDWRAESRDRDIVKLRGTWAHFVIDHAYCDMPVERIISAIHANDLVFRRPNGGTWRPNKLPVDLEEIIRDLRAAEPNA